MNVYMMIKRKKQTVFTYAKDTILVLELKKMIGVIMNVTPDKQKLYYNDEVMEDSKTLFDYGLGATNANVQNPAPILLALKMDNGEFEQIDIVPYSSSLDYPSVVINEETNSAESPM